MSHTTRPLRVLFRVAAGPRVGFGHLVRASSLARAMGVPLWMSVRGAHASTRETARRFGARVFEQPTARAAFAAARPDVLIVDDRVGRQTAAWRREARRRAVPIISIHDLGLGLGDADVIVDGSVGASARLPGARSLLGPRFAILNPRIVAAGSRDARVSRPVDVLIALGGGPRITAGVALARAIVLRRPGLRVGIARGFVTGRGEAPTARGVEWIAPAALGTALAGARAAVVGGGVTLYECLAVGVPAVGVSVVASQRPTVAAFARREAAVDGGSLSATGLRSGDIARLADRVVRLLENQRERRRLSREGRALVDRAGAARVAGAVRRLAATHRRHRVAWR